jgi:hypothetical protein
MGDENTIDHMEEMKMTDNLRQVLTKIGQEYRDNINNDSRHYLEISIAKKAARLGFSEAKERYKNVCAIVPLKRPVSGMKVRIDGRTFVNYAQFESGIVVPNYVAREVDLPHRGYNAKDSMICNFA